MGEQRHHLREAVFLLADGGERREHLRVVRRFVEDAAVQNDGAGVVARLGRDVRRPPAPLEGGLGAHRKQGRVREKRHRLVRRLIALVDLHQLIERPARRLLGLCLTRGRRAAAPEPRALAVEALRRPERERGILDATAERDLRRFAEGIQVLLDEVGHSHQRVEERTAADATLKTGELGQGGDVRVVVLDGARVGSLRRVLIFATILVPFGGEHLELTREARLNALGASHRAFESRRDLAPRSRIRGRGLHGLAHFVGDLLVGTARLHERLGGAAPAARLACGAHHRHRGVHSRRLGVEDLAESRERPFGIVQMLFDEATLPEAQVARARGVLAETLHRVTDGLDGDHPLSGRLGQAEDVAFDVSQLRREGHRVTHRGERSAEVLGALFLDLGGFAIEANAAHVRVRRGQTVLEQVELRLPLVGQAVGRSQRLGRGPAQLLDLEKRRETFARGCKPRIDAQRAGVRLGRVGELAHLLALHVADARVDAGDVIGLAVGGAPEKLRDVVPAARRAQQLGEGVDSLRIFTELFGDARPGGDGAVDVGELPALHPCDAHEVRATTERRGRGRRSLSEHLDQLGVALLALEDVDHRVERFEVRGVFREASLPGSDGAVDVAELVRRARDLADDGASVRGLGLDGGEALENGEPLLDAARGGEQVVEAARHLEHDRVRRLRLTQHLLVERDGLLDLAELGAADVGRLHPQRDARLRLFTLVGGCAEGIGESGVRIEGFGPFA